jgi:hypothetical protein
MLVQLVVLMERRLLAIDVLRICVEEAVIDRLLI